MSQDDRFVLEEILRQEHQKTAINLPDDKFFEIFSAEQILKSLAFDLDADQIRSGLVGGGNDGGVDSIYTFANRKLIREDTDITAFKGQQLTIDVIIVQSKHKASFEEVAVQKLHDFSAHCLRLSADLEKIQKALYNQSLLDTIGRFHTIYKNALSQRPQLSITFYYATLGDEVNQKVETRKNLLLDTVREFFSAATCNFTFAGARSIRDWFYKAPSKTLSLHVSRSFPWSGFGSSYLCIVPLRNFYNFITEQNVLRGHIFEANVRDYQGDVQVNNDIYQTLAAPQSEDFWWLNNGITMLASDGSSSGDVFTVTDPLIVNGLQTSHELFYYFRKHSAADDKRTLLVRIVKTTDQGSMDRIIKATNSQTKIPRVWLHATEEIHRKIETVLGGVGLYYDRRKNYYKNEGAPSSKIITIPYLSQALAAIALHKPDDARARPTTVAERYYKTLFSDAFPMELYSKCALAQRRVDDFLDGRNVDRGDRLNLTFYLSMYATSAALESAHPKRPTIAAMDIALLTDQCLEKSLAIVRSRYTEAGEDDRAAKGTAMAVKLKADLVKRFGTIGSKPKTKKIK